MSIVGKKRSRASLDFYSTFPKALNNLKKYQESFVKGVETCRTLLEGQIEENVLKINHQNDMLQELELDYEKKNKLMSEDFERAKKIRKLDIDNEFKNYSYDKSLSCLDERKEIAISKTKYDSLMHDLREAQQDRKTELEQAIKLQKEKDNRKLQHMLNTSKLEQKAHVAEVNAKLQQKNEQIKVLDKTISGLKEELVAARDLVSRVADSHRAAPIHHHKN